MTTNQEAGLYIFAAAFVLLLTQLYLSTRRVEDLRVQPNRMLNLLGLIMAGGMVAAALLTPLFGIFMIGGIVFAIIGVTWWFHIRNLLSDLDFEEESPLTSGAVSRSHGYDDGYDDDHEDVVDCPVCDFEFIAQGEYIECPNCGAAGST